MGLSAVLLFAAIPFVLREPRVGGKIGYVFAAACWLIIAFLVSQQPISTILAALLVPRAAMIMLAWIARPAVDAPALQKRMTPPKAGFAIVLGIASMVFTGWPTIFLWFATAFVLIRVVMAISYARLGGIDTNSLGLTRQSLEVLVLAIARLPGLSPSAAGY